MFKKGKIRFGNTWGELSQTSLLILLKFDRWLGKAGGNRHHSDENPGTLTADSSLTRPFMRHFDKQPQKVDVKNVK